MLEEGLRWGHLGYFGETAPSPPDSRQAEMDNNMITTNLWDQMSHWRPKGANLSKETHDSPPRRNHSVPKPYVGFRPRPVHPCPQPE